MPHKISHKPLSIAQVMALLQPGTRLELSAGSKKRIMDCRDYLDKKIAEGGVFYGINTGFGALHDRRISKNDLEALQHNLVVSHACGAGDFVPEEICKLMLFLKIQSLAYGHSGVHIRTVNRLVDMYNEDVIPVIYELGSLGASGDLAPLAHLSLPLLGLGEVHYKGKVVKTTTAWKKLGWKPIKLKSKEGLALLNGTQFMSAFGTWLAHEGSRLASIADAVAALSLDAFDCRTESLSPLIHKVRTHRGQIETATAITKLLRGSGIARQQKEQVQDPYSFRCIPQVHGATKDVLRHVHETFTNEINSVTDNPNIFPEEDKIISGGNFHGQPLAMALDYLAIGLSELGNISERRTYFLVSGYRRLPAFLIDDPGLHSGLMIIQYAAASMVSQNKQLCTPASVDSIDSSNRQEDHVSMGANAATKCLRVLHNLERIVAIELLTAAQALEFRRPQKSSKTLERLMADYRKVVPFMKADRELYRDIDRSVEFIRNLDLR